MLKSLVIVESPAKAKTIQKYLGKGFTVEASLGHVKDLPKSTLGVDTDDEFETEYVVIPGKEKVLAKLKKLAGPMDAIYLAPDPDREGEAIAAHLAFELDTNGHSKKSKKKKKEDADSVPRIQRVTFNEITKRAVQAAFEHPRAIDQNLVDAQQARRVLDRLVGYQVSPLLWDKVRRGLSAGRVQTVALRLIVEREREIKAFEKKEYWTIDAHLAASKPPAFDARFLGKGEEKIEVTNGEDAEKIRAALEQADWLVRTVDKKERRRNAAPPFTTSKLQQDSSRKLRFSVKRTMMIAQRLYEGVELGEEGQVGLITYMRTDSTRVAPEAIQEVREYVGKEYGAAYLPETPNTYKEKKEAQAAHEAIRPTSAMRHPDQVKHYLKEDEYKVYKLIWQRFVASQIMPAVFDQTTVDIDAKAKNGDVFWFRVTGSVLKFDGFLRVYEESKEGKDEEDEELKHKLPALEAGQKLTLKELKPEQHFTEPPPRYNEASLVKELEERGIGRPSTYSAILSTIQERQYVQKLGGKFTPTEIGLVVTDLLVENFRDIFDVAYTAHLEVELDDIEEGKEKWTDTLAGFYKKFQKDLKYAEKHMENIKRMEKPTDEKCERCGSPLVIKWGKHGSFYACSTYDKEDPNTCTFTKENPINLPDLDSADVQETTQEEYCENCGRVMVLKRGRFGQFMACTGYPDCKTTRRLDQGKKVPDIPLDELCPKCGRNMMIRHGRFGEFTACSGYPECKYVKQNFIGVKCPECKDGELVEKRARKGNTFYGCGNYPKCKFTSAHKPIAEKCPSCGSEYLVEKFLKAGPVIACPNKECDFERAAPELGAAA
ncbi:MAG TPA: type I DNA topoisomerase, partial [Candidatus Deferrimicrobiaceae bacterium]|nr:type I DNA topoisomerase [Candidatus Deferrimicrobiaceae bacterium]